MKNLMMPAVLCFVLFVVSLPAETPAAAVVKRIPVEDFFQNPEIARPEVSPDGKHVAMLVSLDKRLALVLLDLATGKYIPLVRTINADIGEIHWKGNDRILFSEDSFGREENSYYSVDIRSRVTKVLQENSYLKIVDYRGSDPDHVLVYGFGTWLHTMNIVDGSLSADQQVDDNTANWVMDNAGVLKAQRRQKGDRTIYETCANAKARWESIGEVGEGIGLLDGTIRFVGFNADNRTLYIIKTDADGAEGIYAFDTITRAWGEPLFATKAGRIQWVLLAQDRSGIDCVGYGREAIQTKWFNSRLSKIAAALDASLPAHTLKRIVSYDQAKNVFIVAVYSDVQPIDYYMLDLRRRAQLVPLGKTNPKMDPAQLQPMKEVTYQARDGLTIHAYLTMPREIKGGRIPLVINPHGGPYGYYDVWGFNAEVQMLANRGYAVLQPNYRGSGGYGTDFLKAGRGEWGGKMQDDLTDGVKWAIAQGWADPARICIYGASYGGYAALAGAVFTPDLYCCAVNYAGVSDLFLITNWMFSNNRYWSTYYRDWIGDSNAFIDAKSPINFIDQIKIPTLHAYGKNDPRVNFENWTKLEAALRKYQKKYEEIHEDTEGHGFKHEENRIQFYKKLDSFLAKYLAPERMKAPGS
jgi:dipeptidyl aminopeptidase/acylaminoacyl peptidase